jgi:putative spermidine/putrescine transport system permease protein
VGCQEPPRERLQLITTPAGLAIALAMRSVSKTWRDAIVIGVLMPLFVPGILIGVGVLFLYSRLGLNNTLIGLVLAHATVALPFVAVTMDAPALAVPCPPEVKC